MDSSDEIERARDQRGQESVSERARVLRWRMGTEEMINVTLEADDLPRGLARQLPYRVPQLL